MANEGKNHKFIFDCGYKVPTTRCSFYDCYLNMEHISTIAPYIEPLSNREDEAAVEELLAFSPAKFVFGVTPPPLHFICDN